MFKISNKELYSELKSELNNVNNEIYIYFLIYGTYKNSHLLIGYNLSHLESLFNKKEIINSHMSKLICFK